MKTGLVSHDTAMNIAIINEGRTRLSICDVKASNSDVRMITHVIEIQALLNDGSTPRKTGLVTHDTAMNIAIINEGRTRLSICDVKASNSDVRMITHVMEIQALLNDGSTPRKTGLVTHDTAMNIAIINEGRTRLSICDVKASNSDVRMITHVMEIQALLNDGSTPRKTGLVTHDTAMNIAIINEGRTRLSICDVKASNSDVRMITHVIEIQALLNDGSTPRKTGLVTHDTAMNIAIINEGRTRLSICDVKASNSDVRMITHVIEIQALLNDGSTPRKTGLVTHDTAMNIAIINEGRTRLSICDVKASNSDVRMITHVMEIQALLNDGSTPRKTGLVSHDTAMNIAIINEGRTRLSICDVKASNSDVRMITHVIEIQALLNDGSTPRKTGLVTHDTAMNIAIINEGRTRLSICDVKASNSDVRMITHVMEIQALLNDGSTPRKTGLVSHDTAMNIAIINEGRTRLSICDVKASNSDVRMITHVIEIQALLNDGSTPRKTGLVTHDTAMIIAIINEGRTRLSICDMKASNSDVRMITHVMEIQALLNDGSTPRKTGLVTHDTAMNIAIINEGRTRLSICDVKASNSDVRMITHVMEIQALLNDGSTPRKTGLVTHDTAMNIAIINEGRTRLSICDVKASNSDVRMITHVIEIQALLNDGSTPRKTGLVTHDTAMIIAIINEGRTRLSICDMKASNSDVRMITHVMEIQALLNDGSTPRKTGLVTHDTAMNIAIINEGRTRLSICDVKASNSDVRMITHVMEIQALLNDGSTPRKTGLVTHDTAMNIAIINEGRTRLSICDVKASNSDVRMITHVIEIQALLNDGSTPRKTGLVTHDTAMNIAIINEGRTRLSICDVKASNSDVRMITHVIEIQALLNDGSTPRKIDNKTQAMS